MKYLKELKDGGLNCRRIEKKDFTTESTTMGERGLFWFTFLEGYIIGIYFIMLYYVSWIIQCTLEYNIFELPKPYYIVKNLRELENDYCCDCILYIGI